MARVPPGSSLGLSACWLTCLLVLPTLGCGDTIALGSECPPFGEECIERASRDRTSDAPDAGWPRDPSGADAGADNGGPSDAGSVATDDGGPARAALFPAFVNPSFEITAGSLIGGLISTFTVQVFPWLSCSPPGFGPGAYPRADLRANFPVGTPSDDEVLTPTEGLSLVNASPDGTSLAQGLAEPLIAGEHYAFLVDVAATQNSTDLVLDVQGSNGCFAPETLTSTPPATAGTWRSLCVRFTPERSYSSVMLSASSASAATGTRLFIDNIRSDPSCR